jgi:hypothetical protein
MRMSTSLWSNLHFLLSKMGVLEQHYHVRAWIIDLWRCTKLFGVHHWKSSSRNRLIWHSFWKHCFDSLYCPTSPTTRIPGCHGCCDHDFVNCWSTHRRSFHDEIDLEMVCASGSAYLLSSLMIWPRCFFINLPVGALTILLTVWFLRTRRYGPLGVDSEEAEAKLSLREKVDRLDPIGSICFLPGIVCQCSLWSGEGRNTHGAMLASLCYPCSLVFSSSASVSYKSGSKRTPPSHLESSGTAALQQPLSSLSVLVAV